MQNGVVGNPVAGWQFGSRVVVGGYHVEFNIGDGAKKKILRDKPFQSCNDRSTQGSNLEPPDNILKS